MQRYICPVCETPYVPSKRSTFPVHGKRWTGTDWARCDGANTEITEETVKAEPKPAKGT